MIVGYTCGVYDLFHSGHIEILKNAKSVCDRLIVGLTTDEKVKYKGTECVIPYDQRKIILESCKYVDCVIPQNNHDKLEAYKKIKFDVLIVGDDWYQNEKWDNYEKELKKYNVNIVYFPYTSNISTTKIKEKLKTIN